jgi:light-regulated signal transduction histidine kinase (bacteriophytochrome)
VSDAGEGEIELLMSRVDALELECTRLRDFAALAAHELLRPVIIAQECAARLLETDQGVLDGAVRADLELLRTASSQVRVLVDTLLADAHRGDSALAVEPVDLARVVRDCLQMLTSELQARGLRVRMGELPVVAGDAVLLTAVFRNLLVNAIRHGSGRHSEIRVFAEPIDGGWRVAVDSPGSPLSEDDHTALFETASRDREGRRGRGAGLGLVLVRRIVARHGGTVGSMSPDDSTNRFFFTLPADPPQRAASRRR